MKILITFILSTLIFNSYCQNDLDIKFKQLYNEQKYDNIINYKLKRNEAFSAKALYYKGMSYYMKSEDFEAMKYIDLAIEMGPVDYDMFFYKGMILYYTGKYNESISYFDKAIALLPNEPDFYAGKAEAFYSLNNLDSAIVYFEKASNLPNCKNRVYLLMGEIYQELNRNDKALLAYKNAYKKMSFTDESFQNCSFNLGLMQLLTGSLQEAKATYENHTSFFQSDYHAIAKLIQVYYSLSELQNAIPYKQQLYSAYKAKKLTGEMKEMFCFDQFNWNNKKVMVFERFEESNELMFVKHHFYILDENGEIEFRIDSESSIALRMNNSNSKYVLCMVKDDSHYTYWQYVFNDDYKYPELKDAVLAILNGKVKPAASFIPDKSNH